MNEPEQLGLANELGGDRDQRLLEHLSAIQQLAQRDQAIRWLANEVTRAILEGGIHAEIAPAVPPAFPPALLGESVSGNASLTPPHVQHDMSPYRAHVLGMMPLEWQVTIAPIVHHVSLKALALIVAVALLAGVYTGHVAIPAWVRDQLQTCQPHKQT